LREARQLHLGPGVVLGRSGASFGQAHYCEQDFWPHNTALYVTDFHDNDPVFVYYTLTSIDFSRHNSGGAQQSLNRNFISSVAIGVPRPSEQRAITRAITDVAKLLVGLDSLIAKKRDLKQAAMQQLLTGQTRLPSFRGVWRTRKFAELLKFERLEKFIVRSADYAEMSNTPVLTANKSFIFGYTNEDFGVYERAPVIIFDDFTTDSKFVTFPFKIKSSAIKILRGLTDDVNLRFVFERMQLVNFPLGEHKRYYISEYQHVELPVPEPAEKTAIVGVLTEMDTELTALARLRGFVVGRAGFTIFLVSQVVDFQYTRYPGWLQKGL
jgi:type I restriction enzyme, S subunit